MSVSHTAVICFGSMFFFFFIFVSYMAVINLGPFFFLVFTWQICSTGRFKGDVSFGSIIVENGGKLEGKVNFGGCRPPIPDGGSATPPTAAATATATATATPTSAATATPSVTASTFKKPVLTAAAVGPGNVRVKLLRVTGASPRGSLRPVPVPIQSPE